MAASRPDPAGVAVGTVVGLAGLLFLADPYVGAVRVGGVTVRPFVLSAGVLGVGFALGAALFGRQGRRTAARIHAVGAVAWLALFAGASVGSPTLVVAGVVLVAAGALTLGAEAARRGS
ncbi:hypothetical protein [Halostella litorea]|uniref:hypothetical protein n=1 Tax=Halostella litorea TaxID=2528831 RepID=UPI00109290D5|nr:hypothetical protein [Halostella litorea]